MALSEFDLIARYFSNGIRRDDVVLGVGDDAAVVRVPAERELVLAVDTLVAGRHFTDGADPADVGYKALAVNLSDLAAMGAEPAWFTLALTLPAVDEDWLAGFSAGLRQAAEPWAMALVGGDTTRGPLTVSIQVCGLVPQGRALARKGARPGDQLYVSGRLGEAGLALERLRGGVELPPAEVDGIMARLHRPTPRVALGQALRGLATSAIDVSDGLAADLGHVLQASGVGATVEVAQLPLAPLFQRLEPERRWRLALTAGDDYELVFTADPGDAARIRALAAELGLPLTAIGRIEARQGLRCRSPGGECIDLGAAGYDHFQNA